MNDMDEESKKILEARAKPIRLHGFSESAQIEYFKFWADHHKHLTTLSTGSIVLIATFLEKVFPTHVGRTSIRIALLGFVVSIVTSVLAPGSLTLGSVLFIDRGTPVDMWDFTFLSTFAAWAGFLTGIIALTVFAIMNVK